MFCSFYEYKQLHLRFLFGECFEFMHHGTILIQTWQTAIGNLSEPFCICSHLIEDIWT